jgi:hypothetical protein
MLKAPEQQRRDEMLRTYYTVKSITGEKIAKDIIRILVEYFNQYITTEEIQQIGLRF